MRFTIFSVDGRDRSPRPEHQSGTGLPDGRDERGANGFVRLLLAHAICPPARHVALPEHGRETPPFLARLHGLRACGGRWP